MKSILSAVFLSLIGSGAFAGDPYETLDLAKICRAQGRNDGYEYAWQDREEAEAWQGCRSSGHVKDYEEGMKETIEAMKSARR